MLHKECYLFDPDAVILDQSHKDILPVAFVKQSGATLSHGNAAWNDALSQKVLVKLCRLVKIVQRFLGSSAKFLDHS